MNRSDCALSVNLVLRFDFGFGFGFCRVPWRGSELSGTRRKPDGARDSARRSSDDLDGLVRAAERRGIADCDHHGRALEFHRLDRRRSYAPVRLPPAWARLRRVGRVARPRGLVAAWVWECCAIRIRGRSVWGADPSIKGSARDFPPGLLLDAKFREGFSRHPQIPEHADLAAKFPGLPLACGHVRGKRLRGCGRGASRGAAIGGAPG